ncbi:MAG: type 2 isopentenyl-diphosphate Delta-isomerase, partial [Promethearchaeota archaeon]
AGEILKNAVESQKMLNQYVKTLISELKTGMFLTGARQLKDIGEIKYVLLHSLKNWLNFRNLL